MGRGRCLGMWLLSGFEWGPAIANEVRGYKDGYLIPDERGGHGGRWVMTL